jgi:carboxylesterase
MPTSQTTTYLAQEQQRSRNDGVCKDGNLPFFLTTGADNAAILLVHGFAASPYEMRTLGETLQAAGFNCLAVRLPGHGTTPEDLAERSWQEWLETVEQGFRALSHDFQQVFVTGMSTGCLLTLALALKHRLDGVVLFSPYLRIRHRLAAYSGWLRHIRPYQTAKIRNSDLPYYYDRRPVAGVVQINRLIDEVQPQLPAIGCPVLAFNGEGDQTIEPFSGRQLVKQMGSAVKTYQMLGPETPHVLTGPDNPHRDAIFTLACQFFQALSRPVQPAEVR